jgi:hypothetical protein
MPGAAPPNVVAHAACAREDIPGVGWQRQAESSELTDGFPPDAAGSAKLKACRCHPHNARKLARTPRTWAHDRKVAAERVARSNSFDRGRSGSSGRHAQAALGRATQGPEPALPQFCRAPAVFHGTDFSCSGPANLVQPSRSRLEVYGVCLGMMWSFIHFSARREGGVRSKATMRHVCGSTRTCELRSGADP